MNHKNKYWKYKATELVNTAHSIQLEAKVQENNRKHN
jgi:hypothetical protein